ncbi:HalOD1 output domain-containing protein [Natronolimnohabitans innermongolicus]|uniref:Halobacterial output domain-containing protein n=1 Tax=Natronolimnohabitans innermongolicus JCM 12255 TaxID=1227499 RepID=L9XIE5_9EURY|nr:HalOD1 output domain-containing protein [Natronolimnohabitans innermongolicus]ELY61186.1 hypothetical protein C493_02693 [Natronolimnohabitans innermongolicus JCM 12255]
MDDQRYTFSAEKSPTMAVVESVAAVSNTEPTELPPLYDAINPDALDSLFESSETRDLSTVRVSFPYNGYDIAIQGGSNLTVELEAQTE